LESYLSNIKNLVKRKTNLASLALVPAVIAGLGLLIFQTYSLITGKSFNDLDFNIEKLWETSDVVSINEEVSNSIRAYQANLVKNQQEVRTNSVVRHDFIVPRIKVKKARLFTPSEVQRVTEDKLGNEIFEVDKIDEVSINTILKGKQLIKYFNKLESDYLINPYIVPRKGKWYIGFSFAPTLNYRTFSYDPSYVSGVAIEGNYRYTFGLTENQRNVSDKSITSYTVGIDIGRRITKKFSIFSGFHYAHYGEQILVSLADLHNPNYEGSEFMGHKPQYALYDTEDGSKNIPYKNKYSYLEVPLGISMDFLKLNKSKVTADVAVTLQKLDHVNALVYDFETDYYYWMNSKEEVFRKFGVGTMGGVTLSQFVGERLEMFVNPHFKINLNSTFKKPYPVEQNQYSTGLRLGLKHQIR